jgi:hypothetical protein
VYSTTYYVCYLAICALLVLWLSYLLNRSGAILLSEAFNGNAALVSSVTRLLDIGFYLMSFGYVAVSYHTFLPLNTYEQVGETISWKVGGFLLLLGFVHLFNLLLLAIFRRRGAAAPAPVAS